MEVFSPVAALAASLIDEPESQNSTRIEENISGELFNKPAAKAEKTDTRNKEEVHKKTSNKAKETGKAPDLIPAKKTKNDHESMNPAKQTKNDYEILVPAKEKAKPEAKAAEEAKAKEEQAAKEKEDLAKIEKEKQEALRIEAERQAQAARANDAEAAAAEAEYREAHQKRLELEQLLEEKLKEKGLRDQQKQSEKSLNAEESNKLEDTEENKLEDEKEEGFLDKVKNFFAGDVDIARMMEEFRAQFPTEQTQEEIDAGLIMVQPFNKQEEEAPKRASFRSAFRSMAFWLDDSEDDENSGLELSDEEVPGAVGANPNDLNLDGKKFTVMTRFETSNALGPIKPGQYFNIHLDKELTVKDPSSLEPVRYNGQVIATPTYNSKYNIIEYKIVKEIPENIKVPLNIPVDYNPDNITEFNNDGTFTVTNKVSGLGVKAPKDLIPQKVDKNGNLAGSIIEPGRGDVPELIESDDKSYKVDMDAVGIPVVENGVLKGFNWTAQVVSTVNLNGIDFHVNFTTVKGSGLGEIQNLALGGVKIDNPDNNGLTGKLGIVDSVHYKPAEKDGNKFTYTFYTPVTDIQETYMLDINAVANGKVGAKRIVGTQGYPREKVADATPKRVGMNNRTSILGEFANSNQAKWTVTDQVSTGDDGKLPLASRKLGGNQTLQSGQVAVYGVDTTKGSSTYGQMVQVGTTGNANPIPEAGNNPTQAQPVGTISAYEYTTNLDQQNPSAYTLGGVAISKMQDLSIDQNWGLDTGAKMPAQDIKAVDPVNENNVLGTKHVDAATDKSSTRRITIPNVKVWDIDGSGNAKKIQPKVVQDLPKEETIDGKTFQCLENYNYYEPSRHEYYVHNRAIGNTKKKFGKFILNKTGTGDKAGDSDKPLEGATFRLFPGPEVVTDKDGKATFDNIEPGKYTLMEVKAPLGYKPADDTTIVVDDNGVVRAAGDDASQEDDKTATKYYEDDRYPAFMNVKSYAKGKKDDTMTTYIYLKPTKGGGTNQNTRLDIVGYDNNNGLSVEVFDVSPGQRDAVSEAMDLQNSPEKKAGGNVLGSVHRNAITGGPNTFDSFTQRTGYQIKFPYQRFDGDWGFLVKITGRNNSSDGTVSYDWLTENNPGNNAKIRKAIYPVDPSKTSSNTGGSTGQIKDTIVTIKNEKFETSPVEVTKVTTDKEKLGKATFVLKDSDNNILKTVTSISTEGDDKGKVNFGQMPPGHYVIEEVASPDGYIESQLVFDVVVDNANQVTYSARFKDGKGTPVQGVDYWIENEEIADENTKVPVTHVDQKMYISENNPGEIGTQDGVWEAYRYESLNYEAKIKTNTAQKGSRLTIQFDPNLDFTQYVNEIPKLKDGNTVIAEPYFNYDSNTLTYVFNQNSKQGETEFSLKIVGIIPSKFYAKNSGTYSFTNVVAPGQTNVKGNQSETTSVKAFYDDYDSARDGSQPTQMYYFRDVYKEGDQWYVKALAYYNPMANAQGSRRNARTLSFNWMTTNWFPDKQIARWEGYGQKPAYELDDLKVYRVLPVPKFTYVTNEPNMPRSMGIIPENDPNTYNLVYSQKIDPSKNLYDRQGNISVTYDPSKIISSGGVNTSLPLSVSMPQISPANEGYVIEQTFKVTDLDKFRSRFRTFYMTNGNLESAFASKVNLNEAAASQASKEIPKYYKQRILMANEKYVPAKFSIKKFSEADKSLLAGAVFTLTDKAGKAISRTTGSDGILTFDNLKPGEYTLKEIKAPENFNKVEKTWNINVSKDGYVTIREISFDGQGDYLVGDNLTLDVSNRPSGTDFKVYKKDDTNQPLQGAEFTLTKDGKVVQTVKSDVNGLVNFKKLTKGTYILEEKTPPAGFKNLTQKWVVEVGDDNKAKVYEYKDPDATKPPEKENTDATKSLFGNDGTKWVDVAHRPLTGWSLDDNRWGGYTGNNHAPYKMGTRILGINKDQGYVIQRYVINPEAGNMNLNSAVIHREKPQYNNMTWYEGNEEIKAFILDKPVTGYVEDIRLQDFGLTELNIGGLNPDLKTGKIQYSGGQNRLSLQFTESAKKKIGNKPIVIDVKVPYNNVNGGVGTGMDLYADGTVYWKSDYYESVSYIVEGNDVVKKNDPGAATDIKGDHVSDDSLDVTNERERHNFKFKKVDQKNMTDAVTGATFKLTGPKKSDQDLGQDYWAHSGTDGMVNFDNLVPGTYKLEETGAAQGYAQANTDWTVTILDNGKVYIKDNNQGDQVPDTSPQWQKVTAGTSGTKKGWSIHGNNTPYTSRLDTRITEVNPKEGKFRQVYIINKGPEKLLNPYFEIHSQEENRPINLSNTTIVSLVKVGSTSTAENLISPGAKVDYDTQVYVKNNGQQRLKITPKGLADYEEQTLALTIESTLGKSGNVGTGIDFVNYNESNQYWMTEYYESADKIQLDPPASKTTDKNAKLQVPNNFTEPPKASARSSEILEEAGIQPIALMRTMYENPEALEISEDFVGISVRATGGWEQVDPSRSDTPTTSANPNNPTRVHTKITHINKDTKQFKQVFLINGNDNNNSDFNLNIHRQPRGSLSASNVSVRVFTVGQGSTVDNLISPGNDLSLQGVTNDNNITGQVKIRFNNTGNRGFSKNNLFAIEVTSTYTPGTNLGLGMDYYYKRDGKPSQWSKYWGAQNYTSDAVINKIQQFYNVNIKPTQNGKVTSDKPKAKYGEDVTITVKADPGYRLKQLYINGPESDYTRAIYEGNGQMTFPMGNFRADVYATFERIPNTAIVSFNPGEGSGTMENGTATLGYNNNFTMPENAFTPPPGKIFKAWKAGNNEAKPGDVVTIYGGDIEFTAVWIDAPVETVTVSFDKNGGTGSMPAKTLDKGSTYKLPACNFTAPANKEFKAWQVNGVEEPVGAEITVSKNTTVKAIWKDITLTSIRVNSTNHKTAYKVGDSLDVTNLTIEAIMSDGSTKTIPVTANMVSGFDSSQEATNKALTISYGSKTTSYNINISKADPPAAKTYEITINPDALRTVNVSLTKSSSIKAVEEGERVDVSVTINDSRYLLEKITVTYSDTGQVVKFEKTGPSSGYFIMPKANVSISTKLAGIPRGSYPIKISETENGFVEADKLTAAQNQVVTLTPRPNQGYKLQSYKVLDANNREISLNNNQFTMPASAVTVSATFVPDGTDPGGGSQDNPDDPNLGYLIYDPTDHNKILEKDTKISNKKQGFVPKIFKRNAIGKPLGGATFTVKKMKDNTYKTEDTSFAPITAKSDPQGNVTFTDKNGKIVALDAGYYTLTEDKPPTGYKRITADWKIQVKDDGGRVYAVYKGPSDTPSSLVNNNEKSKAGDTSDKGIKVKSRLTDINPENKTFVQRIYIDTRNHSGILNVQITPKHKREEIDRPGLPPVTIKEGVKTAYRSTYKISNAATNKDITAGNFDHILRTYDLSGDDVSMVNTARWRPFDWGFDEDQLNLEPGVYIVEVEGYYDDSIIDKRVTNEVKIDENYKFLNKEGNREFDNEGKDVTKPTLKDPYDRTDINQDDLAKLGLHVDLYEGKREFKQLKLDKNGNKTYEVVDKGSYQGGASQVTDYVKSKEGADKAKTWSGTQDPKTKYANFVGREVKYDGETYETGKVEPALGEPLLHADTSINLKPIYDSAHEQELPKEGMEIINDEETYNITFSKHGKDDPKWDDNGEEVTKNRLEGAIFKLQELAPGGYIDRPGTFVSSAFNGYFGFRGLPPGRYRLMEVKAPEGYKPIKDAILYMTIKYTGDIVDGKTGEITPGRGLVTLEYNKKANGIIRYTPDEHATEKDGKLVDYVTSATAKNMGKIINEKPGKGRVTLNKKDGEGKALNGANFTLTRLSSKLQEDPTKPADGNSGVSYSKNSSINDTAKATVAAANATKPKVENGEILSLDPVKVGASQITGKSILEGKITLTFPGNVTAETTITEPGKFTVNVPTGVSLKTDDQVTVNIKKDGMLIFDELPIGNYLLEETKSPDGYQNKGQKWYFTVGGKGLDPYAGPVTEKGQDRTSSISIANQVIEVVKPNADDKKQEGIIKPNSAHVLSIKSKFKLDDGMDIKPGDYFKVKLSDYMDLKGIYDKELIDGLDIFAEGIGTIAKADYDYDNGIITYTFTDYANTYDLKNFETSLTGHIRTDKLKYSAKNVPVGIKMISDPDIEFGKINVVYELDTASHTDDWGNNLNIASKITKFNPQTGEFEHIIYLNREQNFSNAATLVYKPGTDVVNLHVEEFKIEEKWTRSQYRTDNINLLMPPSFYVKPNNTDFRKPTDDKYSRIVNDANPAELNYNTGDLNWDDTYIIRVTGQIAEGKDRSYYNPKVRIDANNYPVWSAREDYVYEQWNKNLAEGKMEVTAINPKNEITFKKLDQAGEILPGATFKLVKYNEDTQKWDDVTDTEGKTITKTSGQDGLIKYEKLAPGKYGLVETAAPEGYSPIEGHAAEFTVGDDGVITRKVKKPKDQTPVGEKPGEKPKAGESPINPAGENQGADPGATPEKPKETNVELVTVDEPVGNGPINIINYKDIEFVKVDAEDKNVFLKGAEFEVYKKDDKGNYQPVKETKTKKAEDGSETTEQVTMTVTSDENGKFKPKINKPGDYALKETKAPEGYSKMPGWIREFRLADGKLYTLEKDPIKASHTDSTGGMITSEVLTVDKDKRTFTQRIVINPNHKDFTIPNFQSYLRIFENDWSITPKADGENKGGKVKVALIGKDSTKKISDLKDKDFTKEYSPVIYKPEAGNTRSAYSLKEITGNGQKDGQVTTTDTIVVEYTGALAQGKTKVDQKAEVILNYSIADQVDYSLDWTVLTENKSVYDEYDLTKAVEVENRKAEYPHTGGMGTLIFTLAGLVLMSAAAYVYSRKRGDSYDGEL